MLSVSVPCGLLSPAMSERMNGRVHILVSSVAMVIGCASPAAELPPGRAEPAAPTHERRVLGESRQGRPIER